MLDEDGVRRRKQRRLRRRQYFSRGPNSVWHLDGYDKLKPYGISIHGCIDGFSRRVIWLEADITNKRPEVVAEYYLSAVQMLKGCPEKIRADPGAENGLIATFHSCLKSNGSSVTFGTSTANQRIERFWGLLRQMRADFWIHHFKVLVYEDLLVLGNPIHRLCIQYVYLPLIKKDLREIMEHWNNHSIRRQKLGDTIHGIPDVLFKNPEIVGALQYLYAVDEDTVAHLQKLISETNMAVLGKKLMEAFKSQTQRDVKIKLCDGTIIQAHRVVLVLGAKWFEARLRTQMKQMSAIEIPMIFSKPIPLNRDIIYTLVAHTSGGQTYYSVGGVSSANRQMSGQINLKITFHDPVCGRTNNNRDKY
uniref:Uncharacterized protein LOC111113775 n=1 Tax=Crassostrea virginica TaxID=6565 RepID=A0A8B8BWM7_CRAVI|nr:uncharacterized protein LOC111113775 [Crassostrea virginica]